MDTKLGRGDKDSPVDVAEAGFKAMMRGEADVVTGWQNKVQTSIASVTPSTILAEQHRKQAQPGSAKE
jgi:short-subunit dehydrogenase